MGSESKDHLPKNEADRSTGKRREGVTVEFESEQAVIARFKAGDLSLVDEARGAVIRNNGAAVQLTEAMRGRLGRVATRGGAPRLVVLGVGLAAEIKSAAHGRDVTVIVGAHRVSTR